MINPPVRIALRRDIPIVISLISLILGYHFGYFLVDLSEGGIQIALIIGQIRYVLGINRVRLCFKSIKPFVTGRKNWLFANTPRGPKSSAIIFSVIETAKQNGLNPFRYMAYLFEQLPLLPNLQDPTNLAAYLPWSAELPAECRIP
jgi:hypothetical protein